MFKSRIPTVFNRDQNRTSHERIRYSTEALASWSELCGCDFVSVFVQLVLVSLVSSTSDMKNCTLQTVFIGRDGLVSIHSVDGICRAFATIYILKFRLRYYCHCKVVHKLHIKYSRRILWELVPYNGLYDVGTLTRDWFLDGCRGWNASPTGIYWRLLIFRTFLCEIAAKLTVSQLCKNIELFRGFALPAPKPSDSHHPRRKFLGPPLALP